MWRRNQWHQNGVKMANGEGGHGANAIENGESAWR